mgnify:CR=1 FL=1
MNIQLPLFIVFEGIDGSGKSTLCDMLYGRCLSRGVGCVLLREPTDGVWGRKIREILSGPETPDPEEQVRLFIMDREDDVRRNILPAMAEKRLIIMDRYYYSNAAYQGAMGIDSKRVLNENIRRGFPAPDRVYFIDVAPGEAIARIQRRNGAGTPDIFEKKAFLESVRGAYLALADERFVFIDGARTPGESITTIMKDIEDVFGAR